jgi:N-acetylglucosamine-6-sulfatase
MAVDDSDGRVMQFLKQRGLSDDTLVMFMGDNGFLFGEHGLIDKRNAYEESMRVPLLAHCPSLLKPGSSVEGVVANIDVGPTVLDLAGLQTPDQMDGRSFVGLAAGATSLDGRHANSVRYETWYGSQPAPRHRLEGR